jgi:uncharacterized membrane protein
LFFFCLVLTILVLIVVLVLIFVMPGTRNSKQERSIRMKRHRPNGIYVTS